MKPTQTAQNPSMLSEQLIEGLRVIYLGPTALVASERASGTWYHINEDGQCGCPDHVHRQKICKHMRAAAIAAELDRVNATPASDPEPAPAAPALLAEPAGVPGYLRRYMPAYSWA
jgi:hypothetical protein